MALQHLRSGTAHKRPIPTAMSAGQIAVNTNEASPGLFFKDSNGDLVKVGPVHIGTTAPNASPASTAATALVSGTIYQILTVGTTDFTTVGAGSNTVGHVFTATGAGTGTGTVSGQQGVEKGEQWLDTTGGNYVLKIYDGTAWRSESGTFVDSSGDTMTGALLLDNAASASAPDLSFDGDSNTGIYSPGANKLAISTGGGQRLVVDEDGDVGIGTGSPASRLEIVDGGGSGSAEVLRVKRSNGADSCVFRIDLDPDSNIVKYQATGSQSGAHVFGTGGGSESMRIGSNGRVGIGTTSPTQLIDLEASDGGRIAFTDTGTRRYSIGNAGTGSSSLSIRDDSGAADRIVINNAGQVGIGTSTPGANLHLQGASFTNLEIDALTNDPTLTLKTSVGEWTLRNDASVSDQFAIRYDNANRFSIDSTGNVGIGDSTPSQKLDVNGNIRASSIFYGSTFAGRDDTNTYIRMAGSDLMEFRTGNSERMRITSSGSVGIGTSNPTSKLQVEGTIRNNKVVSSATGDYTRVNAGAILRGKGGRALLLGVNYTDDIPYIQGGTADANTGTRNIVLQPNGANVGIGEVNPEQKLDVYGQIQASDGFKFGATKSYLYESAADAVSLRIGSDGPYVEFIDTGSNSMEVGNASGELAITTAGTEKIRIKGNGNVGIGTTAPTELLEIEDDVAARTAFTHTGIRRYSVGTKDNSATFTIRDETGSADRFTLRSTGNIGIGTGEPGSLLHINKSDNNFIKLSTNTSAASTEQGLLNYGRFISGTTPAFPGQLTSFIKEVRNGSAAEFALLFGTTNSGSTDATERMRITGSGKVGIGTTAPSQELVVAGGSVPTLRLSDTDTALSDNEDSSAIEFYQSDASGPGVNASIHARGDGSTGRLALQFNAGNNTEKMRITNNGFVGIGDTDPNNLLSIAGSEPRFQIKDTDSDGRFLIDCNSSAGSVHFRVDQDNQATNSNLIFSIDNSEKMRLTNGGRLFLGTSGSRSVGAPVGAFQIEGEDGNEAAASISRFNNGSGGSYLTLGKARGTKATPAIVQNNDNTGFIEFAAYDGGDLRSVSAAIHAYIDGTPGANDVPGRLSFRTTSDGSNAPTERMRISSNGDIKMAMGNFSNTGLVGQNATGGDGVYIDEDGGVKLQVSRWNGTPFGVNRMSNDGDLIAFFGQGTNEGGITLSGTTVSLTGGHLSRWSQLESNAERTEILRGSVLSNLDEMCEWGEEDNEQLNRMKVSDVEGDPNVAGVFQGWDDEDETYLNDFHCAMTGDFIIRIAQGTTVARGDLLMSAGDGTAKPQGDDIVRSKTVAKVTSTTVSTTYADGSYCVPCVLMAC